MPALTFTGPVLLHDLPAADTILDELYRVVGYVIHIVLFIPEKLVYIAVQAYHAAIDILPGLVMGAAHYLFKAFTVVAPYAIAFLKAVAIFIAIYFVAAALFSIGGCLLSNLGDNHRSNSQSSTYSHETARLFHQPQPSSYTRNTYVRSQSQTYGQIPATPAYNRSPNYSSHGHVSHPGESRQTTGGSHQTASTSTYAGATYQHSPNSGLDSARISKLSQSSLTHSHIRASESAHPQAPITVGGSKSTRVAQLSPVPVVLSDPESDELDNLDDLDAAAKLRERAGRLHSKMLEAHTLAKSARSLGDYAAEGKHEREATTYESARDQLNTRAAEIIFKHTNKVCI
jgi:hypothetical protein